MYNDSKNQWRNQESGQDFLRQDDFFDKQMTMPDNLERFSDQMGQNADVMEVNNGEEKRLNDADMNNPEMPVGVQSTAEPEGMSVLGKRDEFSHSKEFTKADGKITEIEIRKLMEDPAAAYEDIQSDKEEYLNRKFGRIFGESK